MKLFFFFFCLIVLAQVSQACICSTDVCSKTACVLCDVAIGDCVANGCGTDITCIAQCLTNSGLQKCISCVLC